MRTLYEPSPDLREEREDELERIGGVQGGKGIKYLWRIQSHKSCAQVGENKVFRPGDLRYTEGRERRTLRALTHA